MVTVARQVPCFQGELNPVSLSSFLLAVQPFSSSHHLAERTSICKLIKHEEQHSKLTLSISHKQIYREFFPAFHLQFRQPI
uniref:Putative ovule protein n=1 Tax=Solanum chacoense TaxID=4108 RepID=A0A0V0I0N9_SOLCH